MALQHICDPEQFELLVANITLEDLEANERLAMRNEDKPFRYTARHGRIEFDRSSNLTVKPEIKFRISTGHNALTVDPHKPGPPINKPMLALCMLRDPKSRVVSSFLDSQHHEGMNESVFQDMKRHWSEDAQEDAATRFSSATAYANHPHMIGCYVKMLNGYPCSADVLFPLDRSAVLNATLCTKKECTLKYDSKWPLNQTAIDVARRRLSQFRFVGIFEQFNLSVHLLHRVMGTNTTPSAVELFPQRTTENHTLARVFRDRVPYFDPYDSIVYAEAKKMFAAQLRKYKLE